MNFCSQCGAGVMLRVPPGDSLPRHVCNACGTIHYLNPKLVVGAIAEWGDRVLLCRRAIEPRSGYWTLPAGFMENAETTAQAAARETLEEACARIEVGPMFTLINVPHISQVHIIYRARLLDLAFSPGEESLEVALFSEADIPWQDIAFRTISMSLRHFFEDRRRGQFGFHVRDLPPMSDGHDAGQAGLTGHNSDHS
ncbi:MAG: NUDIX hydrolase [Rhodocyclaceae bacterium]|jgi:ADP-ribose pyrophosphatase YjhB (NUDIX family)|nr:NUDIX hydrolase [Rhodocyclaceae bacterium]